MKLEGWDSIPSGYSARFDVRSAPLWLRIWFHTPFLDRFSYPVAVRRGYGKLRREWLSDEQPGDIPPGWRMSEPHEYGMTVGYEPVGERPPRLRRRA